MHERGGHLVVVALEGGHIQEEACILIEREERRLGERMWVNKKAIYYVMCSLLGLRGCIGRFG